MRILMLGNSLTTANGLPDMLGESLRAQVEVHARGGARLAEHLNPASKLGMRTQEALAAGGLDYVVLQEMSNGPVRSRARFLAATEQLAQAIRAAGAQPVLYATWAHAPGCPKLEALGMSHVEMHGAMHAAALQAVRESDVLLADACQAFFAHPDAAALYAPDGVHPSPQGSRLAADVLARAIGDHAAAHAPASAQAQDGTPRSAEAPAAYTVYLLRCQDGSYYTGITTDVERRLAEHLSRGPKAANYTRTHPVAALAATWQAAGRAEASRLEYRIKRLSHAQKRALEQDPARLAGFLGA